MTEFPVLPNPLARRLFLAHHGLVEPPTGNCRGAALDALIARLGFVQVDSISTVARAHDMILYSRRRAYRPPHLGPRLERQRTLFEHWTHDASIIPTAFFPHWRHRFVRDSERLREKFREWQGHEFEHRLDEVLERIDRDGPATAAEAGGDEPRGPKAMWQWHPSKTALEYLWRTGALMVTRREGFRKVYDLTERVIPAEVLAEHPEPADTIDWACGAALDRLGFATSGELAAFFGLVTPDEAKAWCNRGLADGRLEQVLVENADGSRRLSLARPGRVAQAASLPPAPSRVGILSPFDPALRDRNRAERLFGFHYRIEIYVPEAKRRWGYYVFPVLEGEQMIGRIDMKRDDGALAVTAYWPEKGVRMGKGRLTRLEAELDRVARFAGCDRVVFGPGWLRD